jgi:DNA-binding LacI/PurR family transcriptional regulator
LNIAICQPVFKTAGRRDGRELLIDSELRTHFGFPPREKQMAHTMSDVARRAGVSPATVSRVLSKSPYIAVETVNKVLEAVEELNYRRNVHARRLATGKSDVFGLVISEITNPFFPELIRGFQAEAWDRGFDVLLLNTEYSRKRMESIIEKLIESDVRGVAIMTSSLDASIAAPLTEQGIGVVFCNFVPADRLVSNIRIGYEHGIAEAIEHVVSLGHNQAAVIAGPETSKTAVMIKQELISGLKQRGLDPYPVVDSDYHLDSGATAVQVVLSAAKRPTVIFCGSDLLAMGALTALEEAGIEVPEDISVVGIDDISFAHLTRPPLTTISVPREQLGLLSFQALDKMTQLKRQRGTEYSLETHLVVRKSTGPVGQKSQALRE